MVCTHQVLVLQEHRGDNFSRIIQLLCVTWVAINKRAVVV